MQYSRTILAEIHFLRFGVKMLSIFWNGKNASIYEVRICLERKSSSGSLLKHLTTVLPGCPKSSQAFQLLSKSYYLGDHIN